MPRLPDSFIVTADAMPDARNRSWVEVMVTGENVRNGPYYWTITAEDLATYANDIKTRAGRIPIDYDHPREGDSTRAAGWYTGASEVRGESLWAEVEWTPKAAQEIKDGEFRFVSAEFSFEERDKVTGLMTRAKNMLATTLTNRPFMEGMAPLALAKLDETQIAALAAELNIEPAELSRAIGTIPEAPGREATEEGAAMPDMKALAAALGLPEDATEEQIIAAAKEAKKPAAAAKPDAVLASVREALGLEEDADEAAVIVAARSAHEATTRLDATDDELESLRGADQREKKLQQRVKALEDERLTDSTKRILTEGVRAGKVLPAEKAVLAKQFATNPDGLLEILATRPERSFTEIGAGGDDGSDTDAVRAARQNFSSELADGVDTESAVLHARAMQALAEQGKRNPTEDEYANALELVGAER